MAKAIVRIATDHGGRWNNVISERKVAVRFGMQGFGSVELDVLETGLWPGQTNPDIYIVWRTLGEVLAHPQVRSVTFTRGAS